ncbi:MAG: ATP-binding protein [Candidatus Competibacter sp.]|nr:ATP-binding protein [Candidatus Competibacter sp.]HRD49349.1 ATP-binding protein [Candidatus Contendobacter sp.]
MSYQPPRHPLEILQKLDVEEALDPDDPRYVNTRAARGSEQTSKRFAKKFGLSPNDSRVFRPTQRHVLFFGHIGSGKTTELRRYVHDLSGPGRFFTVEVNIIALLDRHNLHYPDVLMSMAHALLERLGDEGVALPAAALRELERWFADKVLTQEDTRELTLGIETAVSATGGVPYLLELLGRFTAAFKNNHTYKESLRRVIRNTFRDFAAAFNDLLREAEKTLLGANKAVRVLFLIDGTDKLRDEDTRRFFVYDVEQMLEIAALAVYTAPINLKYESHLAGKLDADLVLPMIKLHEKDGARHEAGWSAMRDILLRRADRSVFASEEGIERLIEHSGGHPRELLILLKLGCEFTEEDQIGPNHIESAIKQLASEYRRFLEPDDYALLARIDNDEIHAGNDERTRRLLYNLALLEYNDASWRRSHPVVRTLEGYQRARAALLSGTGS